MEISKFITLTYSTSQYKLTRTEMVSLLHSVNRLSESVESVQRFLQNQKENQVTSKIENSKVKQPQDISHFDKPREDEASEPIKLNQDNLNSKYLLKWIWIGCFLALLAA